MLSLIYVDHNAFARASDELRASRLESTPVLGWSERPWTLVGPHEASLRTIDNEQILSMGTAHIKGDGEDPMFYRWVVWPLGSTRPPASSIAIFSELF